MSLVSSATLPVVAARPSGAAESRGSGAGSRSRASTASTKPAHRGRKGRRRRRKGGRKAGVWPLAAAAMLDSGVRMSADSTASRPCRFSFGYCLQPGLPGVDPTDKGAVSRNRAVAIENWCKHPEQAVWAVVDGHGLMGLDVAKFVAAALPGVLNHTAAGPKGRARSVKSPIAPVMREVAGHAVSTLHQLLIDSPIDVSFSGASVTVCMLHGQQLVVSSIGSCRAVLGRVTEEEEVKEGVFECLPTFPDLPPLIASSLWYPEAVNLSTDDPPATASADSVHGAGAGAGAGGGAGAGLPRVSTAKPKPVVSASTVVTHLVTIPLSLDHRPDRPDERIRLIGAGARVEAYKDAKGSSLSHARVLHGDPLSIGPGLRFSRTLGATAATPLGVLSAPEVVSHTLVPDDKFVILATDSVWLAITSAEAVRIVWDVVHSTCAGGSGAVGKPAAGALSSSSQRCVLPPVACAHPTLHATDTPYSELVSVVAPDPAVPDAQAGMGGGSTAVLDLTQVILDPAVRASRLHRRRTISLAASEAIVAEASARWAASKRPERVGDVSAVVILLEW